MWAALPPAGYAYLRRETPPGPRRFLAAVTAGLTLAWSNGVTEGHIHRLKLMKRQGYGRAGFALPRQRVLRAA